MAKSSGTLDKWRKYFLTANSDIFDIIERAIMVAASDCPKEFKLRRDRIAEMLFTCKVTKCFGCDKVELAVPDDAGDEEQKENCKIEFDRENEVEPGRSKESKVNSAGDDDHGDGDGDGEDLELNVNHLASTYSYGDAEALTDEIEEESQIFGEVLRIKEILENCEDESDSLLFDSLIRLQLMGLSVEILKATEIGKAVNALRRHGSKQIRQLAKTLVDGWVVMVDEWMNVTAAIANGTPESLKKSDVVDEEEGLPSPPLDEGAFITTQPMELSQFFDGMDDDGNPRKSGEFNKNRENGRKPSLANGNLQRRKQQIHDELITPPKDQKVEQPKKQESIMRKQETVMKKQAAIVKPSKPSVGGSGPGRPTKPNVQQKVNYEMRAQQKSDKGTIQKREFTSQPNNLRNSDKAAVLVKLEASKRKLQERYQEAENAKKQRTIQVMELRDIPKQGLGNRNPHMRPGNHSRHWANGRR